jgi:glutamate-1-semialdehyde-2,1-aminomutase
MTTTRIDCSKNLKMKGYSHPEIRRHRDSLAELVEERTSDLDRQRRLYEAILSSTPDLVYIFDLDYRFTYANAALLRMWDKTWAEAIGKTCLELGYEPWHADMHNREIDEVVRTFREIGDTIAAVIVEPIAGNMNMVLPQPGFLQALRDVCTRHGTVLIFDEVMTGFRVAPGSAQGLYGITPDLSTFGKVIGGGMPLGAFGGRRDVMAFVAPIGPVYQAGTLSGNPVAVAAGLATLEQVLQPGFHDRLGATTRAVCDAFVAAGKASGIAISAQSVGGMFGMYFSEAPPTDFAQVMACDGQRFNAFFHRMLGHGVYLAPSAYEAGFVSIAHSAEDVAATAAAARDALTAMAAG